MAWTMAEVIGYNARRQREELRMDDREFAAQMEAVLGKRWQRQTISAMENGKRAMAAEDVAAIAYVLYTTPAELFTPPAEAAEVEVGSRSVPREHAVFTGAYLNEDERTPTEAALSSLRAAQRAQEAIEAAAREQRWLIYQAQNTLLGLPAPKPRGQGAADLEAASRWYLGAPGEDPLDAVFADGGYINDDEPPTTK